MGYKAFNSLFHFLSTHVPICRTGTLSPADWWQASVWAGLQVGIRLGGRLAATSVCCAGVAACAAAECTTG